MSTSEYKKRVIQLGEEPWRVLVSGANGYVARRLIPELLFRGYTVRCMYRNRSSLPILSHPNIEVTYASKKAIEKDEKLGGSVVTKKEK